MSVTCCVFVPIAGPDAQPLEDDVSIDWAGVADADVDSCYLQLQGQRPQVVQHTAEELVGVLHKHTEM